MAYKDMFTVLVVDSRIKRSRSLNDAFERILGCLRDRHHLRTDLIGTTKDAVIRLRNDASVGCLLLEWGEKGGDGIDGKRVVQTLEDVGLDIPVFLVVAADDLEQHHQGLLVGIVRGLIYPEEDTPDFVAKYINRHFEEYIERLKTPFFGRVIEFTEASNEVWTCPGHNGGMFYRKSPVGHVFYEYLGEPIFRTDLDNSVVELGDLLLHEGPAREAETAAAEIFGADRTYFVLNGTSTSNQIVTGALVSRGDLVLFDRNNHKSNHHGALVLGGGIPVYLPTDRNPQGMVGPIHHEALDEGRIRDAIRDNPLVTEPDRWQAERPFRLAIIEQCTYDGTIYNAQMILDRIGHLCDYILFDEAWGGFLKFHPLFAGHYAMGLEDLGPDAPGIVATQSTHKQLAGFSQASQIHLKARHITGQPRHVTERRFNETFLLHASTSPFYPLFSSLDVGAQMMKGRNGFHLWNDATRLAVEMRKAIRNLRHRYESEAGGPGSPEAWFFDPFVPDVVTVTGSPHTADLHDEPWENVPNPVLLAEQQCWLLRPGARWHGFTHLADGYVMTDPNKLTLVTPGFDRETGGYLDWGVPAPVLAQFLRERGIIPEKNDLNTILFLITPGIEVSKAGTLIAALDDFKRLFDRNARLRDVTPAFVAARPRVYGDERLRDLCLRMHDFYRKGNTSQLQRLQFQAEYFPEIALSPQEATRLFTANRIDYVPIDEVSGRVAATMALVYPPGIGIVVPGERWDDRAAPMIGYLKLFEESYARFPGFANEIQGVYPEEGQDGRVRLFTYVIREQ
ncbi:MAG TPA: Orn/Lys/Arg decarboxylase N-terminal domain-containing protein [Streptosporangiaceae bacterium]|nr:Orn/Lys/Arg decarboxylase N-terminal domain-containing protein [Streptosporangiaceae bacterium]